MTHLVSRASATAALLAATLSTSFASSSNAELLCREPAQRDSLLHKDINQELRAIVAAMDKKQSEWRSLPNEADAHLRVFAEKITFDGMSKSSAVVQYVPGGYVVTTLSFTPPEKHQGLGSQIDQQALEKLHKDLEELRKFNNEGFFKESKADFGVSDNKDFVVQILSIPGEKAALIPKLEKLGADYASAEGRAQIWTESLALLSIGEAIKSPAQVNLATKNLEKLRDTYLDLGDSFSARLAQAVLAKNVQGAGPLLRYVGMGRITQEEMAELPTILAETVKHSNFVTRHIPTMSEHSSMSKQFAHIELPSRMAGLITLEERSGFVDAETSAIARIEVKNALGYAANEIRKLDKPTCEDAIKIVRKYFEQDFPSDYRFRDSIQGLATGLSLRRTDCSTRGLLAMEMMNAMGFESGVEIIMAQKNGIDLPGVPAHLYNYALKADGSKVYADFCSPSTAKYVYPDNSEILSHYVGDSGLSARVAVSTSDSPTIYGALLREPVGYLIKDFTAAFEASKKDLMQFLTEFPEWRATVERLKKYSKAQDEIFETNETKLWEAGTQKAIKELYGR